MALTTIIWSTTVHYLREFSSIAGLSHAAKAPSFARSVYWLSIFFLGLAFTIKGLIDIIDEFDDYPVVVNSKLTTRNEVPYPAVTVCNLNRVHCPSIVNYILELDEVIKYKMSKGENATSDIDLATQLQVLAVGTDCISQTCYTAAQGVADKRTDPSGDFVIVLMSNFGCYNHINPHIGGKMCYHLYQALNHDASVTGEAREAAEAAWAASGCTEEWACKFAIEKLKIGADDGEILGLELATVCYSSNNNEERKKREAPASDDVLLPKNYYMAPGMTEDAFAAAYMRLDESVRRKIGHHFEEFDVLPGIDLNSMGFFKSCQFQGEDCVDENVWTQFATPNYGNCYTFNTVFNKKDTKAPRKTTLTGSQSGLTMEIFLDQLGYMTGHLSPKAGALFVIHNPDEYPLVNEFGTMAQPGTSSMISMHMNDIELLPDPHPSDCYFYWNETDVDLSLMSDDMPRYSLTSCQRYCQQAIVMKECDCYDTLLHLPLLNASKFDFKSGFSICNYTDPSAPDFQCVTGILNKITAGEDLCPTCHISCEEVNFETSVTAAGWPSDRYWINLARDFGYEDDEIFNEATSTAWKSSFQNNYLKATIYFKSLNVREIIETPKYTADSTLAALGGALSLFLGVAIIMLFEIIELSYNITINCWGFNRKNKCVNNVSAT